MSKDILYPLRRLHGMVHEEQVRLSYKRQLHSYFKKNPKTVFLVMTPEHGNLGDHAIASAEISFLNSQHINFIEITDRRLDELQRLSFLSLLNKFPILVHGGGYIGTLWPNMDKRLQNLVRVNRHSPIFILPNTAFYENSPFGEEELQKAKALFNHHKRLYFCAREKNTLSLMEANFNHVKLVPDMVLLLNKCGQPQPRHGCLLCLRSDLEKTRSDAQEQLLRQQVSELFGNSVKDTDMVVDGSIMPEQREEALNKQFSAFSQAELVITDRLHGMIFCAITGTPCIVINSKSPKVRGCYEWIKNLDYIRFADCVEDITAEYKKIPRGAHTYDNSHFQHYYQELKDDIFNILHWR